MNNQWGDKDVKDSARTLTTALSLDQTCLRAVPRYFQLDQDPSEILGEIFTALRRQYPEEYMTAFRTKAEHLCKDCAAPVGTDGRRGYCATHYRVHLKAKDFK